MDDDTEDFFADIKDKLYQLGRKAALDNRPRLVNMGPFYYIGYDETKQLHMDIPFTPIT